ncbi:MAG: hypothetical protein AAGB48_12935 [Planctomycetota bacterium]
MSRRVRVSLLVLAAGTLVGCGDTLEGDRPTEVRVQRIITLDGTRTVSYTAMFDDGIETYIDRAPLGDVDLITIERDGAGGLRKLVADAQNAAMPADGPEPEPIDDAWRARFRAIDALVDEGRVPWSDAHGLASPNELNAGG